MACPNTHTPTCTRLHATLAPTSATMTFARTLVGRAFGKVILESIAPRRAL